MRRDAAGNERGHESEQICALMDEDAGRPKDQGRQDCDDADERTEDQVRVAADPRVVREDEEQEQHAGAKVDRQYRWNPRGPDVR